MKILQFSGGKDSLACLYLLREEWNDITVCWVNTGKAFPETLELMERVKAEVPHFYEVRSNQTIDKDGYPADIVPISRSTFGQYLEPSNDLKFQSRYQCCSEALWKPMGKAMQELRATTIIRGQKKADKIKPPFDSGSVQDGVKYIFPLEFWTDDEVFQYLRSLDIELPRNYEFMSSGLDCWNCTAYLEERGKLEYLRLFHSEKYAIVRDRLTELSQALEQAARPLRNILQVSL